MGKATGLRVTRLFTKPGEDPLDSVAWAVRDSRITNPDGSVVFEMKGAEIPTQWSQVAADIMVSKYFRKAGVPQRDATGKPLLDEAGQSVLGPEHSARSSTASPPPGAGGASATATSPPRPMPAPSRTR
jgi:ribonucleoside-diphosphate reductase alpha chain